MIILNKRSLSSCPHKSQINQPPILESHKQVKKLFKFQKYKQIIFNCERLLRSHPENALIYYYLGLAHLSLREYTTAIANWTKAIKLNSQYDLAYNQRGQTYAILGKYFFAFSDLTAAIKINPKCSEAYFYRALLHHSQKNYELAYADYENAIFLDPYNKIARSNKSIVNRILTQQALS
ncbi:MAG: tetratricopeptide repeat protein [Prochloraceae cyanobacterium]|nr:tetratricopeptide repeat protein [Prochloraceae cyanobacterium]